MIPDPLLDEVPLSLEYIKRGRFKEFVRQAWHLIEPARPLSFNWAIDAVCEHLEAVTDSKIKKLIINVPPGTAKSSLVSVLWPVWEWQMRPSMRWMFASYAERLSLRDSSRRRDTIISSDWYQDRWGDRFQLLKDNERYFTNDKQGSMFATSTGGTVTGFRSERNVLDDPQDPEGSESEIQREGTIEWLNLTWPTRLNDTPLSAEVLVMQRLHQRDATGLYLEQGGWEHLKIPAEYEGKKYSTSIGWCDPREKTGELIDEAVQSRPYIDDKKRRLGSYGTSGQLQQEPSPTEGGLIKKKWFRRYRWISEGDLFELDGVRHQVASLPKFIVIDPAASTKSTADYTAIGVCGTVGKKLVVLEVFKDRLEGPDQLKHIQRLEKKWAVRVTWAEPVAYQLTLIQHARRMGIQIREIPRDLVDRDKVSRAIGATPMMEAGEFYLPEYALWLGDFEAELIVFPNGENDDQVDVAGYMCAIARKYYTYDGPPRAPGIDLGERDRVFPRVDTPSNPLRDWTGARNPLRGSY